MEDGSQYRPRVLVLSDSVGFVGPDKAYPTDDPRLWPNIMARELDIEVEIFAGFGWTSRRVWFALGHDPRLWAELAKADVVILGTQFDSAPSPLPNFLWNITPQIHSPRIRRYVWGFHKRLVRFLCRPASCLPGGGPVAVRPKWTRYYLQSSLDIIHGKRPGIPVVGTSPGTAPAKAFAHAHAGWPAAVRTVRSWSTEAGVPLLDFAELTREHMFSGRCNPDGMHMGWEGHTLVGKAAAELLDGLLPVRRSAPPQRVPAKNGSMAAG